MFCKLREKSFLKFLIVQSWVDSQVSHSPGSSLWSTMYVNKDMFVWALDTQNLLHTENFRFQLSCALGNP